MVGLFLTFSFSGRNKKKAKFKACSRGREVQLVCQRRPWTYSIGDDHLALVLILPPISLPQILKDGKGLIMFVLDCMLDTEPMLHAYMSQDDHSHTTGTYSHRPERDGASMNFPRTSLKACRSVERSWGLAEAKQRKLSVSPRMRNRLLYQVFTCILSGSMNYKCLK